MVIPLSNVLSRALPRPGVQNALMLSLISTASIPPVFSTNGSAAVPRRNSILDQPCAVYGSRITMVVLIIPRGGQPVVGSIMWQ